MEWTNQHDTLFLREVRASDLYETRKGSPERGMLWDEIAARLNSLSHPKFIVNKRSLRDRLNLLMGKFEAKNREEERASGFSPELQEIDTLLEELSEKEEAKNKLSIGDKKQNAQQEKAKAEEMRLKAMETMGQTKKRVEKSDEVNSTKKRRKSTGDAIGFLEKKAEQEMALQREEIEMRKQGDERFAADNSAAGNVKDDSATAIRSAEVATKKSNPTAAIYVVHVEPTATAITGSS